MTGIPRHQTRQHPWFHVLRTREMELLDPDVRANPVRVRDLLHDDFVEFGSTGKVYNKRLLLDMLKGEKAAKVVIREFSVRQLAADTALVTYRTVGESGQEARRSSVWIRSDGAWKLAFHQGTRIQRKAF
jgi:ribonuclease HI